MNEDSKQPKAKQEPDMFAQFVEAMDEGLTRFAIIKQAAPLLIPKFLGIEGRIVRQDYEVAARESVKCANILANEIMKFDPARKIGGPDDDSGQD